MWGGRGTDGQENTVPAWTLPSQRGLGEPPTAGGLKQVFSPSFHPGLGPSPRALSTLTHHPILNLPFTLQIQPKPTHLGPHHWIAQDKRRSSRGGDWTPGTPPWPCSLMLQAPQLCTQPLPTWPSLCREQNLGGQGSSLGALGTCGGGTWGGQQGEITSRESTAAQEQLPDPDPSSQHKRNLCARFSESQGPQPQLQQRALHQQVREASNCTRKKPERGNILGSSEPLTSQGRGHTTTQKLKAWARLAGKAAPGAKSTGAP